MFHDAAASVLGWEEGDLITLRLTDEQPTDSEESTANGNEREHDHSYRVTTAVKSPPGGRTVDADGPEGRPSKKGTTDG